MKRKLNIAEIEQKLYEIIKKNKVGIERRELWKISKIKSEDGTKALIRLLKKGSILQMEKYVNGKKVYILKAPSAILKILPLESIYDVPCLPCGDFNNCSELGSLNPTNCVKLNNWLES